MAVGDLNENSQSKLMCNVFIMYNDLCHSACIHLRLIRERTLALYWIKRQTF